MARVTHYFFVDDVCGHFTITNDGKLWLDCSRLYCFYWNTQVITCFGSRLPVAIVRRLIQRK